MCCGQVCGEKCWIPANGWGSPPCLDGRNMLPSGNLTIAMENGTFGVDLPIKNGDFPLFFLLAMFTRGFSSMGYLMFKADLIGDLEHGF